MNGWSSHLGADRLDDEPAWVYEITWEWEPLPGQRYPGDPGRRRAVHTPVWEASRGDEIHGVGRAIVNEHGYGHSTEPAPAGGDYWPDPSDARTPAQYGPDQTQPVPGPGQ